VIYEIQGGDTLLRIAQRYGTTVSTLMQMNNLSEEDITRLRPGREIVLPSSAAAEENAAVEPSDTPPAATATPITYTLQEGDNPLRIAQRFGVSVDALLAINGLTREDARTLRIGQSLIIPSSGSSGASAAPANRSQGTIRLDAPILSSPQNSTPMSCRTEDSLVWEPVPFIAPADKYILHLGFVSALDANQQPIVSWILEQERASNRTSWDLDTDYCSLAPQSLGRQWRWYVEVIDENGIVISPPSEIWNFSWN
jgi:LysM repeat protein